MNLKQHLMQRDPAELRIFAQNQGLVLDEVDSDEPLAVVLAQAMLAPEHVQEVWADLSPDAREALFALAQTEVGMPALAFQRRFGEIRRLGIGRLQVEQPWKTPTGPAEALWWLGWLVRVFRETGGEMVEYITLPSDLSPLLPVSGQRPQPPFPGPAPEPQVEENLGEMLLDDLTLLLAYVQNHPVPLRKDGRWRKQDLTRLVPRLRLSRVRKQPLEAGGPLHLLFLVAKKQGLLVTRRGYHRLGKALRPWLEQTRAAQMATLFRVWQEAGPEDWNDLCLMPEIRCQEGDWANDPILARKALLQQLARAEEGVWYDLDDLVAMMYEHFPDFQRPDANYDTWYLQNSVGDFLRGFEHWPVVEGALIRYIWRGPLFWLGAVALGPRKERWRLTSQGRGFLEPSPASQEEPPAASEPILHVDRTFRITLAPHISVWDHLRVALFAFWQASEPRYQYLITQRGLRRAQKRGVSAQRILAFLERASQNQVPGNVRRALSQFDNA